MRKITLFVATFCILSSALLAQSIGIYNNYGIDIANDTVLIFWHSEDPNVNEGPQDFERKNFAKIVNISSGPITIAVQRKVINAIPGTGDLVCWGGECLGPNDPVANPIWSFPTTNTLNPTDTAEGINQLILYFDARNITGEALYNYKLYNQEDANDSASIFIRWSISTLTNINEISTAVQKMAVYPNPATTQFTVDLNAGINAPNQEILIRDMLGKTIRRESIQSLQEKFYFSTEELSGGIYFVSYALDGEVLKTKKLVVK